MFPRSASGAVSAGGALMEVKGPKNHRWHLENCNNLWQMLDFWYTVCGFRVELGPAAESEKLQIKAVSLFFCFLSCLTALSSVVSAPLPFSLPVIITLSHWSPFACFQPAFRWWEHQNTSAVSRADFSAATLCRLPGWANADWNILRRTPKNQDIKAVSKPWPIYCVRAIGTLTRLITNKQSGLRSLTFVKEQKGSFQISCLLLIIPSLFKGLFSNSIAVTSLKIKCR